MLDKEDLKQIGNLLDTKLDPIHGRMDKSEESLRETRVIIENEITPRLKALAEGQRTLLDTLAAKSRVEALEDEVAFLKQMIRTLATEVNDLKKAQ